MKMTPGINELFPLNANQVNQIESLIENMSVKQKIGQMLFPGVLAKYYPVDSAEFQMLKRNIEEYKIGGVIFFKGTVLDYAGLANTLQKISELPLIIGADFERGLAMRIDNTTPFPYNMCVAATSKTQYAFEMARVISKEARAIGVHHNYAPVADICSDIDNPVINLRAYSSEKETVTAFCEAFIQGAREGNVISCIKHFPGHGNTKIDSHRELPLILSDSRQFFEEDIYPFAECIKAGAQSVMTGHLDVPASGERAGWPSVISHKLLTELLRGELGFNGLIITDAMNMYGLTDNFSVGEAAVEAVLAGNDMLLMPPDIGIAVERIYDAFMDGRISGDRINASVKRILSAKFWLGLFDNSLVDESVIRNTVAIKDHYKKALEIAESGLTLIKNQDDIIPCTKISGASIITLCDNEGTEHEQFFAKYLKDRIAGVKHFIINNRSSTEEIEQIISALSRNELIILALFARVRSFQGTVKLSDTFESTIRKLQDQSEKLLTVSFGNPFIINYYPFLRNYLVPFGDTTVNQIAVAECLIEGAVPTGKSPVRFL